MRKGEHLILDEAEGPVRFVRTDYGWARVSGLVPVTEPLDTVLDKLARLDA